MPWKRHRWEPAWPAGLPESWEQLKPVSPVLLLCPRGWPPAMSAVRCGDRPRSEKQSWCSEHNEAARQPGPAWPLPSSSLPHRPCRPTPGLSWPSQYPLWGFPALPPLCQDPRQGDTLPTVPGSTRIPEGVADLIPRLLLHILTSDLVTQTGYFKRFRPQRRGNLGKLESGGRGGGCDETDSSDTGSVRPSAPALPKLGNCGLGASPGSSCCRLDPVWAQVERE